MRGDRDQSRTLLVLSAYFIAGLVTVGQFSFWGNYLPRVYPVHLRGTGESFAANIGGRMFGTSFAWIASEVAAQPFVPGASDPVKMAYTCAGIAFTVYAVGLIASFWLPEPGAEARQIERPTRKWRRLVRRNRLHQRLDHAQLVVDRLDRLGADRCSLFGGARHQRQVGQLQQISRNAARVLAQ